MQYQTYRRVNIDGSWVGTAYYGLTFVILLFLPIYLFLTHGHLEIEKPIGVQFARPKDPPGFSTTTCHPQVLAAKANCTSWDWLEAVDSGSDYFFISTFVRDRLEVRGCNRTHTPCGGDKIWTKIDVADYYIAGTENLMVNLEHRSFTASGIVMDSLEHTGFINTKSETCGIYRHHESDNTLQKFNKGKDSISILNLLRAAGIDLDSPLCKGCRESADGLGHTLRRWGAELDITIYYSNLWPEGSWFHGFFPGPVRYQYCVRHIPSKEGVRLIFTAGSSPFLSYDGTSETRIVRRVYGVRSHIHISGHIGTFSWKATITFLTGAIALLTLPWTLTELYLSVLPMCTKQIPKWYNHDFLLHFQDDKKSK